MCNTMLTLLALCIVAQAAQVTASPSVCGPEEVPAKSGAPQLDRFCKQRLVLPTELYKPRRCLCKPGFVRNAWGECVSWQECYTCAYKPHSDFSRCFVPCPKICGRPAEQNCRTFRCIAGCTCAPGYVLDPWRHSTCVPVTWCPPKCPPFSSFQICSSNCAPKCGLSRPRSCYTRCNDGECVCWPGFVKDYERGEEKCVPLNQCRSTN